MIVTTNPTSIKKTTNGRVAFAQSGAINMKMHDIVMIDKDGQSSKESVEIGTPGVEIYNSYFENKGIGIAIWNMGRKDITVRNNIFSNTFIHNNWAAGPAIFIANSRSWDYSNIQVSNNVFDNFYTGVFVKQESETNSINNVFIRNNVFMGVGNANIKVSGTVNNLTVKNNLKELSNSFDWIIGTPVTSTVENNISGNPGFKLSGQKWNDWYKAVSGNSLVIDNGIDIGLPYNGLAPDIGRWEY